MARVAMVWTFLLLVVLAVVPARGQGHNSGLEPTKTAVTPEQEVPRSTKYCTTNAVLGSLYDCSCFAQKVLAYRQEHGMATPFSNVVFAVNDKYADCVGPVEQVSAYGAKRASTVMKSMAAVPPDADGIAQCTGGKFAQSFRAKPFSNSVYIDGLFNSAFTKCRAPAH